MSIRVIDTGQNLSIEEKFNILGPFLKKHGNGCLSYSTLQKNTDYFLDENMGYIAYHTFRHPIFARTERKLVLSDPITGRSDFSGILERFLRRFKDVSFLQISSEFSEMVSSTNLQINQFGVETEIELDNFSLRGECRGKLRQWKNKCSREGVEVFEKSMEDMKLNDVRELSGNWLKRKGGHEFVMLTRPLEYRNEKDVRYFWAVQNNRLVGMGIFDPIYQDNKIIGYYHNFDRLSEKAPHGTSVYIVLEALQKFREEGKHRLSLGLSPLSHLEDDFAHNKLTAAVLKFTYRNLNFIYPFQGNASHKKKYDGIKRKTYFSCSRGNNIFELIGILKCLKLW